MNQTYIAALDQGTTSSRTIIFNAQGEAVAMAQREFTQHFPNPGWVSHDAEEIWQTQYGTLLEAMAKAHIKPAQLAAIGITNQRETSVIWHRDTGKPLGHALVWQDRRTAPYCEELKRQGLAAYIKAHTGLPIDAYFSATKIQWMLDHYPNARALANEGWLRFGTIDTWLLWNLTKGRSHATDFTNASRTMLFNIGTGQWDAFLLEKMGIPASLLPQAHPSMHHFGMADIEGAEVPVLGIGGDQQAALFGQGCFEAGMAKNTYGTGCFMLLHTGNRLIQSENGLLSTVVCGNSNTLEYALEGSVFIAGAAIQWLRDGLKILERSSDSEPIAMEAMGSEEVFMVPAFVGLGAPYWDMYARGAIFGLTRDTGRAHLVKATLEALAYQTKDVLEAMQRDARIKLDALMVDGGACANNMLMQFQADMLRVPVQRPAMVEVTAIGAAYLAGIQAGIWTKGTVAAKRHIDRTFAPSMPANKMEFLYSRWQEAVKRTMGWLTPSETIG